MNQDGWLLNKHDPTADDYSRAFPVTPVDWHALANPPAEGIQVLWVGHATVLVQMGGVNFLTDPIFSQRCSPFQWVGPRRVVPPALTPADEQLPNIDFVVISHNHYDHLDYHSVRRLNRRYGDACVWYVPLRLSNWLKWQGVRNVVELDWWQQVSHRGGLINITMVPAQHWSARTWWDRYHTLWGGYVVSAGSQKFYFAGDTGYCPVFREIGERFGPIDVSAIPIGAYAPRWFIRHQHVDPQEAVLVHEEVRSKQSIGIHCCTFALSDEALDEPPLALTKEMSSRAAPSSFITLQHGERLTWSGSHVVNTPKLLGLAPTPVT